MMNATLPQLLAAIQSSDDGEFLRVLAETTLNRLIGLLTATMPRALRAMSAALGAPPIAMVTATACSKPASARWTEGPKIPLWVKLLSRLHSGAAQADEESPHCRHLGLKLTGVLRRRIERQPVAGRRRQRCGTPASSIGRRLRSRRTLGQQCGRQCRNPTASSQLQGGAWKDCLLCQPRQNSAAWFGRTVANGAEKKSFLVPPR